MPTGLGPLRIWRNHRNTFQRCFARLFLTRWVARFPIRSPLSRIAGAMHFQQEPATALCGTKPSDLVSAETGCLVRASSARCCPAGCWLNAVSIKIRVQNWQMPKRRDCSKLAEHSYDQTDCLARWWLPPVRPRDCTTAAVRLGGALVVAAGTIGASLSALPPLPSATSSRLSSRSAEREAKVRPGRPGAAERVGLPAPGNRRALLRAYHGRACGAQHRRHSIEYPYSRDQPPAELLYPARFDCAGGASRCAWCRVLRVEGSGALLGRRRWRPRPAARRLELSDPTPPFAMLRDHVAFYAAPFDRSIDGKTLVPQPGTFYGGWITPDLAGPFKGVPGSTGW